LERISRTTCSIFSFKRSGRIVEQEVRLVEEEDELGLGRVAGLGKLLEQLRQQPQQEGA
jgi:hypothetical protein